MRLLLVNRPYSVSIIPPPPVEENVQFKMNNVDYDRYKERWEWKVMGIPERLTVDKEPSIELPRTSVFCTN